jgi:hypothetical protein
MHRTQIRSLLQRNRPRRLGGAHSRRRVGLRLGVFRCLECGPNRDHAIFKTAAKDFTNEGCSCVWGLGALVRGLLILE